MARNLNLQVVLDTIDRATAPLKKIATGSRGAGKAIQETRDQLRTLEGVQKNLQGFRNLKRQSQETATALNSQERTIQDLSRQIDAAGGSTKRLTQQKKAAIRQAQKLKKQYGQEQEKLQKLRTTMRSVDGVTGSLSEQQRELTRRIEATNNRLAKQKTALDRIGKARVGERFNNMTQSVGRFARQTALAGTIAGGGLFALANSTASLGDEVAKTADQIGIATAPFQELRYAAERSGVSVEKFDSSLERFVKRTGEATMGTGAAQKAFDELGLSADNLAEMAPEQALGAVADGLAAVDSHTRRVALAAQIFGREGVAMINMMKDGSAGLEELRRQGRLTGYVLSEQAARDAEVFKDRLLDSQLALKGMKNVLGAELMPVFSDLMRQFSEGMIQNRDRVEAFAKTFVERFREAIPTLLSLGRGLASTASVIGSITSALAGMVGGFDNLGFVLAALWAMKPIITIIAFAGALKTAGLALLSLATTLPGVSAAFGTLGGVIAATPIGWLIGGIAAIAVGAYLLIKHWDTVSEFFAGIWGRIKEAFSGGLFGIVGLLLEWSPLGVFTKMGSSMIDGIKQGILGSLGILKNPVTSAAGKVAGWFKGVLGINSPSRVFAKFGENTMEGYQQGIRRAENGPLRQVGDVAKRIGKAGAGIALGGAMATSAAAGLPASIGVDTSGLGNIVVDSRAPLSSGTGGIHVQGDNITLNVYPSEGMNEEALARHIEQILDARDRQKAARIRSAFHDID